MRPGEKGKPMQQSSFLTEDGLLEARYARDAGMAAAADGAERQAAHWAHFALEFLKSYAIDFRHTAFIAHDVVSAARYSSVPTVTDERSWGVIFRRALKAGYIRKDGYRQAPHRHLSPTLQYRSLI